MKIAVIGATGLVGNAAVQELSARGHQVTAFARNVNNVFKADNVQAVAADVNAPEFAQQLAGFDAVVSAFNPGWSNPNLAQDFTKGANAITDAAKAAQVPYLLVIGGAGSLYIAPGVQLVDTPEFPKDIYPGANAARNLLNDLQSRRDVNWAFLSPAPMFGDEPNAENTRTGKYRIGKDDVPFASNGELAGISTADLACAIADDVENKAHLFQRFVAFN